MNISAYQAIKKNDQRLSRIITSENNSIKFISKYDFSTYFDNLILFTKKTMKDKGIQHIIKKTIEDYKNESVPTNLEYKEENIFYQNEGIIQTILNENNFKSIYDCFNSLEIKGKNFCLLCNEKRWDFNEFYEKKEFFLHGLSLKK